jgi:septation ring formation regulator EzrA
VSETIGQRSVSLTIDERFDRIESNLAEVLNAVAALNLHSHRTDRRFERVADNFEKVHELVKSLERTAELLLESASKHEAAIANLEKQWQAYITTLPKH